MRALARLLRSADAEVPDDNRLHRVTLMADLFSNSLYYSAVAASTSAATWQRGALLGLAAGVGAVALPEKLGLGTPPHGGSLRNQVMTVAWYVIGGLAAAVAANAMRARTRPGNQGRGVRAVA